MLSYNSKNVPIENMSNFNATAVIESNTWSEIDSTNAYIEALMTGGKWGDVDPSTITTELNYYIYDNEITIDNSYGHSFLSEEETAFIDVMEASKSYAFQVRKITSNSSSIVFDVVIFTGAL